MKRIEYIKGQVIGDNNIIFLKDIFNNKFGGRKALVKCECGNEFETSISYIKCGDTKSCGCKNILAIKKRFTTHGKSNSKYYDLWVHIKGRCLNKNDKAYNHYGGRGIKISNEWLNNFDAFYDYISTLDNFGVNLLTLDRINNNGNYERGNLRWASRTVQVINQRIRKDNKSGIKGIHFNNTENKWKVRRAVNGKRLSIGTFGDFNEAILALNNFDIKNKAMCHG